MGDRGNAVGGAAAVGCRAVRLSIDLVRPRAHKEMPKLYGRRAHRDCVAPAWDWVAPRQATFAVRATGPADAPIALSWILYPCYFQLRRLSCVLAAGVDASDKCVSLSAIRRLARPASILQ